MHESIIECILTRKLDPEMVIKWLITDNTKDKKEMDVINCTKGEFVINFLSYLRNQTELILKTSSLSQNLIQNQTPEKFLSNTKITPNSTIPVEKRSNFVELSEKNIKKTKRVKTKLFTEDYDVHDSTSENSLITHNKLHSSTPLKFNEVLSTPSTTSQSKIVRSNNSFETPKVSRNSSRVSSVEKSFSLGDFITNSSRLSSKKIKNKNVSNDSTDESSSSRLTESTDINLSLIDFPEIGSKRAPGKHQQSAEKRRIKPTSICENVALANRSFRHSSPQQKDVFRHTIETKNTSFDTERCFLKNEREKLLEKFNLTTGQTSIKVTVPQNKHNSDFSDLSQSFIEPDISNVEFNDMIDILVEIYDSMLKHNLIVSINMELYYLISILFSKQCRNEYAKIKCARSSEDKMSEFLLSTVHNCAYFATKTLWNQRFTLRTILDRSSSRYLAENACIKKYSNEFSQFLLEAKSDMLKYDANVILSNSFNDTSLCFNFETDNLDNFPTALSFQNFKKQRDIFFEIHRSWMDSNDMTTLRSKIKSLLSFSVTPSNHKHLARLFHAHLINDCILSHTESKLSKLQRRLTSTTSTRSNNTMTKQPRFLGKELFYKDFLVCTECDSFRSHVRDILSSELFRLDANFQPGLEDNTNSINQETRYEYYTTLKKSRLMGKFLGFLLALPYCVKYGDYNTRTVAHGNLLVGEINDLVPTERILESDLSLRDNTNPPIDIQSILKQSIDNCRLSITIPWIVQLLSMLDYTSLRIKYYRIVIKTLFQIYRSLTFENVNISNSTMSFLRICLCYLFEMPQFPQEMFYNDFYTFTECNNGGSDLISRLDHLDLIDECCVNEVCSYLKDFNNLLASSVSAASSKEFTSTFRHITPVSITLDPVEVKKLKEEQLQAQIEEELVRSQPSSTRRVLELVTERVASATIKHLTATLLTNVRCESKMAAAKIVRSRRMEGDINKTDLLTELTKSYSCYHTRLLQDARKQTKECVWYRCSMALESLLPYNTVIKPLVVVTRKSTIARVDKWINSNWSHSSILCKDISNEMNNLLVIGEYSTSVAQPIKCTRFNVDSLTLTPQSVFDHANVSLTNVIIEMRDVIYNLLNDIDISPIDILLDKAARGCHSDNIFVTTATRRCIMQLSIDLIIVYASRSPMSIDDRTLAQFNVVWNECCKDRPRGINNRPCSPTIERRDISPIPRDFDFDERAETPPSSDDEATSISCGSNCKISENIEEFSKKCDISEPYKIKEIVDNNINTIEKTTSTENLEDFFNRILCSRNLVILSNGCESKDVWCAFAKILVFVMREDYLSEDSLTEQCLAIYRQDWSQKILGDLSICMRTVSSEWGRADSGKFNLFLDFLAEYCDNLDLEFNDVL